MSFLPNIFSTGNNVRRRLALAVHREIPAAHDESVHDAACFETYQRFWNCMEQIMQKSKVNSYSHCIYFNSLLGVALATTLQLFSNVVLICNCRWKHHLMTGNLLL